VGKRYARLPINTSENNPIIKPISTLP